MAISDPQRSRRGNRPDRAGVQRSVISLMQGGLHPAVARREAWWQVVVAAALTTAYMAGISLMWGSPDTAVSEAPVSAPPEHLVFLPLQPPPLPRIGPATTMPATARRVARAPAELPRVAPSDSGASAPTATAPAAAAHPAPMPAPSPSPSAGLVPSTSARLAPPRAPATPWFTPPRPHNPFVPPPQLVGAELDASAAAVGATVPALAARRVPTKGERDEQAKEAMLKMRMAGRTLLAPPDNSGGAASSSIPLPIFSRGPSKAKRQRDSIDFARAQAIDERLRQRADSLRKWRADSAAGRPASPE